MAALGVALLLVWAARPAPPSGRRCRRGLVLGAGAGRADLRSGRARGAPHRHHGAREAGRCRIVRRLGAGPGGVPGGGCRAAAARTAVAPRVRPHPPTGCEVLDLPRDAAGHAGWPGGAWRATTGRQLRGAGRVRRPQRDRRVLGAASRRRPAEAGVCRLPAETATEFVVRFLHPSTWTRGRSAELAAALPRGAVLHPRRWPRTRVPAPSAALDGIHRDLARDGRRDMRRPAASGSAAALAAAADRALVNVDPVGPHHRHDTVLIILLAAAAVAAVSLAMAGVDAGPPTCRGRCTAATPRQDSRRGHPHRDVPTHHRGPPDLVDADDAVVWQIADLAAPPDAAAPRLRYEDDPERAIELLGPLLADWVSHDRRHRYTPGARHRALHRRRARRWHPEDRGAVTDERIAERRRAGRRRTATGRRRS